MTDEDYWEDYARALRELANARKAFADVFRRLMADVEDAKLYSRGTIANLAKEQGIVEGADQARMLYAVPGHIAHRADSPQDGGGKIKPVAVPVSAWCGMRWKAALWKVVKEKKTPKTVMRLLMRFSWVENSGG